MLKKMRLLLGISLLWLPLSMLFDGINTLVLPVRLSGLENPGYQATLLGLLSFIGLIAGALIQPLAGAVSDRFLARLSRMAFIGLGIVFILAGLLAFTYLNNLLGLTLAYIFVQMAAGAAQAGQQALIPDVVRPEHRGQASGWKGFMDLAGAMLGFAVLGWLLASFGAATAIGVIAGTLVIIYLTALILIPHLPRPEQEKQPGPLAFAKVFSLQLPSRRAFLNLLATRFLFLLGIYAIGRFLLLFVADRLGLPPEQAAEQAGSLLALLALVTVLASPITGWLADRYGRKALIVAGALLAASGAALLISAPSFGWILIFGSLMSLGSAAFSSGSWAMLADLVPRKEAARYFGISNFSVVGAAAAAGLFGPMIDITDRLSPGSGFTLLFAAAAAAFLLSATTAWHLMPGGKKEAPYDGYQEGNRREIRARTPGLAVVSLPADPPLPEEDQDPARGSA